MWLDFCLVNVNRRNMKIALLAFLFFWGCTKKDQLQDNYFKVSVDGQSISCDQLIHASENNAQAGQFLIISGNWKINSGETGSVEIAVFNFPNAPGEYQLDAPGFGRLSLYHGDGAATVTESYKADGSRGTTGKVTILEVNDKMIRGTFEFTGLSENDNGATKNAAGEFYIKRG
jgi:hypothetical protein